MYSSFLPRKSRKRSNWSRISLQNNKVQTNQRAEADLAVSEEMNTMKLLSR